MFLKDGCNDRRYNVTSDSSDNVAKPSIFKPIHFVHNDYNLQGAWNSIRAVLPSYFSDLNLEAITSDHERRLFHDQGAKRVSKHDRKLDQFRFHAQGN